MNPHWSQARRQQVPHPGLWLRGPVADDDLSRQCHDDMSRDQGNNLKSSQAAARDKR